MHTSIEVGKRKLKKVVKPAFGFYPHIKVNTSKPNNAIILLGAILCKENMTHIF